MINIKALMLDYDAKKSRKYNAVNSNPAKAHKNGYRLGVRDTLKLVTNYKEI